MAWRWCVQWCLGLVSEKVIRNRAIEWDWMGLEQQLGHCSKSNEPSESSIIAVFFYIFGPHRPRAIAFVDHGTLSLYHGCKDKDLKRQIAEWMMPDDTVDQFGLVTIGQQLHHDILLFPAPQQMKVPEGHAAFHLAALKTLQHFNRFWDPTSLSFHITGSGEDCIDWHSLWFLVKSFVQQELEMLGLAHSHSLRRQHHVLFRRIPFGFYLPWKPLDSCLKHSMIQWEDHSPSNGCQEHCGQDRWIPMWQCAKLKESWRWHWKLPWHQPNLDWSVKGNEPQAQCRSKKWSRHCRQTELWHLLAHLWKAEGKNKLALKSRMPWHPPCSNNDMTWNGFPQQWTQFSPK